MGLRARDDPISVNQQCLAVGQACITPALDKMVDSDAVADRRAARTRKAAAMRKPRTHHSCQAPARDLELCRRAHQGTPDCRLGPRRDTEAAAWFGAVIIRHCDAAERLDGIGFSSKILPLRPHNSMLQARPDGLRLASQQVALGLRCTGNIIGRVISPKIKKASPAPAQQRQDKNQGKTDGLRTWSVQTTVDENWIELL